MKYDKGLSLRDTLSIFYRRIVWLKFMVIALPLGVFVGCLLVNPVYESDAKVIVTGKQENATLLTAPNEISKSGFLNLNVDEVDLNSEMELLKSMELWTRTVKVLRKEDPKTFVHKNTGVMDELRHKVRSLIGLDDDSQSLAKKRGSMEVREEAENLMRKLKVTPAPKSRILDISFRYSQPEMAKTILSTLLDQYIPYHLEVYSVPGALEFFSGLGDQYKREYEKADQKLADFKSEWGIAMPGKQKTELIALIEQIRNSLVDLNANISQYNDMLTSLDSGRTPTGQLTPTMQRGNENTVINVIATQLLRAKQKRLQVAEIFAPESRDYRAAQETVDLMKERFRTALVSETEVLRAKKISLEKSLASKRKMLAKLEIKSEKARQLQLDVAIAKERYLQYVAKEEEARLEQLKGGSKLVNVSVVSKPFTPPEPIFPRPGLFVFGAFLLAFPLGMGVILLANFLDHTFDNPKDVEVQTGLPVLASLGKVEKARGTEK